MADADVPITAGTGTKIDTRTVGAGTDEHRQVVVIGDPTTAANVASADAANGLDVDVTRLPALPAGTNNIGDVDVLTLPAIPTGTNNIGSVTGNVAHDAADSGNPIKTGAKATWPAIPTLAATADRTDNWSDLSGAQIMRKRPVAMYTAGYRLANATAGTRVLTVAALTANTNKQIATIYHAASATKRVQVKYVAINLQSVTIAGILEFELVTLSAATAPATGNPAITPGINDQADAAAEATCLAIPTTAGSVVNADRPVGENYAVNLGITGTPSVLNPPPNATKVVLWDSRADGDGKDLIMRAATAEGYAINARSSANPALGLTVTIIFTEE